MGILQESVEKIFTDAGFDFKINQNPLIASIDDSEIDCFLDEPREIAKLVNGGILDGGLVNKAALAETKANVVELCQIGTPSSAWKETKIVLAVSNKSKIKTVADLEGKKIIARFPEITKDFLAKNKISAKIEETSSAIEPKAQVLADALVGFTNTGATLEFYKFKILKILLENANVLSIIASPFAAKNKWKREKMENLGFLLKGARLGQEMVGLILHASNSMMEEVFNTLPSLKKPTVTHLRGENWFEVFTVTSKKNARVLIPTLKKIGCTDIVEFPLNKVVV